MPKKKRKMKRRKPSSAAVKKAGTSWLKAQAKANKAFLKSIGF